MVCNNTFEPGSLGFGCSSLQVTTTNNNAVTFLGTIQVTLSLILKGRNYPNPQGRNNLQDLSITGNITLK
jgi:hypothetical protein